MYLIYQTSVEHIIIVLCIRVIFDLLEKVFVLDGL